MIKEGIIKNGEEGSEIIEEILYIAKEVEVSAGLTVLNKSLEKKIKEFIRLAEDENFEGKLRKEDKELQMDLIFRNWKIMCNYSNGYYVYDDYFGHPEEGLPYENFLYHFLCYPLDIQIEFMERMYNSFLGRGNYSVDFDCILSQNNELFIQNYIPSFFDDELLERKNNFNLRSVDSFESIGYFLDNVQIIQNDLMKNLAKEEKGKEMEIDIGINDGIIKTLIFMWSVEEFYQKKNNKTDYLINLTVKVLKFLGKEEEWKNEKEDKHEKEKEEKEGKRETEEILAEDEFEESKFIKDEDEKIEVVKKSINKKEIIISDVIETITNHFRRFVISCKEKIEIFNRIIKVLLEIVKDHLKNERCLLQKGNEKRIIEYIICSYNRDYNTSNLLSLSSPSFPFSHDTILYILNHVGYCLEDDNDNRFIKKDIFTLTIQLLNNYTDLEKIMNGCDIKKEIEREILIEWNNNIAHKIYEKISFDWWSLKNIISSCLDSVNLCSFDRENNNTIKRLINNYFYHRNHLINRDEKEEKSIKEKKVMILMRVFLMNKEDRGLISCFINILTDVYNYSIFDTYYLINKSKGCNIINILTKELSGEIVDRIRRREVNNNNNNNNLIKERRSYERERNENVCKAIVESLKDIIEHTFKDRNNVHLGKNRNKEEYKGKEKEVKEVKDYILDIIEEEDMRECLILYLKHLSYEYNFDTHENEFRLSYLSKCSNNALYHLLSTMNIFKE